MARHVSCAPELGEASAAAAAADVPPGAVGAAGGRGGGRRPAHRLGSAHEQPVELRDPVLYLILADHLAAGDGFRYGFERRPGPDRVLPARLPAGARWGGCGWPGWCCPARCRRSTWRSGSTWRCPSPPSASSSCWAGGWRARRSVWSRPRIWAVWPNLVFHSGIVLTETLFLFLLVLLLIVLLGRPRGGRGARRGPARGGGRPVRPRAARAAGVGGRRARSSCCCGGAGAPRRRCGASAWCWRSPSSCWSRGRSAARS